MGKKTITAAALFSVFSLAALPASAGGVGTPEIEPEVFTATEAAAAGTLGSVPGLILLGVLVGGIAIAGDSD